MEQKMQTFNPAGDGDDKMSFSSILADLFVCIESGW